MGDAKDAKQQDAPRAFRLRRSFFAKLALWMLLVSGLPLLITTAVTVYLTIHGMQQTIAEEVTSLRQFSNGSINRFLAQQQDWVWAMARAPRMKDADPKARRELIAAMHRLNPAFRWVGFADPAGRLVMTAGSGAPDQTTLRALLPPVMPGPGMSDALPATNAPQTQVVIYSTPVTSNDGHRIGTLLVEVDLQTLVASLGEGRIRGSGETYLVRGDGLLISESRFQPGAPLSLRIDTQGFREASAEQTGVAAYRDYRGIPVIGAFEPFHPNPTLEGSPRWALISEVDYAEAMAPAYNLGRATILGTLLMLALIGVAVLVISRQMTSPLHTLEAATRRISQGDWNLHANEGSPDEFGRLAVAFNQMAEKVGTTISELRHSNAALEAADRRVRLVVDNAPVFLFSISSEGILSFAEGQALEGFTGNGNTGALTGRPVLDVFQGYPRFVSSLQRALRGVIDHDEVTLGSRVFQIGYAVPKGEHGHPAGLVGVAVDVTESKKLEAQLAEAQRIAHLGSWEWDLATHRVTWSDELFRIYGLRPTDFEGTLEDVLIRVHPDDRLRMEANLRRLASEGGSYEADYRVIRPDGEVRSLHSFGNVTCDTNHRPIRVFGTAQDITERKQIEEARKRALTLLRAQQESTLDGMLVVDEHRAAIGHNQKFLEIWGIPAHLNPGAEEQNLLKFALPQVKDTNCFLERLEALYDQPMLTARDELELKDGRVLDRYSAPVLSPQGEYFGRIWTFRDVTERKRLENTLREQYTKLRELDQMKNDFVNAISHDLRTPLTSILGYSEFLDEGVAGPLNSQQADYLHQIQKSTERLERMVNDLLDFARLEAGTFKLTLEEVDVVTEIKAVAETMRPQIEDAGLRLEYDFASDTQPVMVDPDRIERVVANLLANAIKFTPAGGVIRVGGRMEGGEFVCEVTDTGVGIAAENLPRLFKRFSQVATDRQQKGGTGLGLHISKSIVEAHGGTIGVVSELGKGSTFWFKLPLRPPASPDHRAEG